MSIYEWAKRECQIACSKENPNYNFDSNEFDYGCNCYKSALKAYKSLCDDQHSGMSFSFTKNILIKLMEGQPLTPITDDDFQEDNTKSDSTWYKDVNLRSSIQCPRMYSLFKHEHLDGTITYHDTDRALYTDIENPSSHYHSSMEFLDEMFPITMPYTPNKSKYEIFAQTFLYNKNNGDFDTQGILYMITPEGEKIELNIFYGKKDGEWMKISKEEYDKRLKNRVDKLNEKIADHLIWTLVSNSGSDEEIEYNEAIYSTIDEAKKLEYFVKLSEMCKFFNDSENYKYNTFTMYQSLARGKDENYKDIPELIEIANFLKEIKHEYFEK